MKITVITLTPAFQAKVDAYVKETVEANKASEPKTIEEYFTQHERTCTNCFTNKLREFWMRGKNEELFKDLPEELRTLEANIKTYEGTAHRDDAIVMYEGKTTHLCTWQIETGYTTKGNRTIT